MTDKSATELSVYPTNTAAEQDPSRTRSTLNPDSILPTWLYSSKRSDQGQSQGIRHQDYADSGYNLDLDLEGNSGRERESLIRSDNRPALLRLSSSTPLFGSPDTPGGKVRRYRHGQRAYLLRYSVMILAGFSLCVFLLGVIVSCAPKMSQRYFKEPLSNESSGMGSGPGHKIMACSHNDEMQGGDALSLALSLGYGFIEVDTHLGPFVPTTTQSSVASLPLLEGEASVDVSDPDPTLTLLAGHETKDLKTGRTLQALYFDPLLRILEANNAGRNVAEDGWVGLYKDDPSAGVVLMIDMKLDGEAIWPYLTAALRPFLSRGLLTTYDVATSTWYKGPLTIVGTGSTPISHVYHQQLRYIFYDAPLLQLDKPVELSKSRAGPAVTFEWDATLSPIASSKLPLYYYLALTTSGRSESRKNSYLCELSKIHAVAQGKGIQSRWWGVARYPGFLRRRMWGVVRRAGASVINGDDLVELKQWLEAVNGADLTRDT